MDTTEYRMTSSGLFHTPGLIAWAIVGYKTERTAKAKGKFVDLLVSGYKLDKEVAIKLLSEKVKYRVDGSDVVFSC